MFIGYNAQAASGSKAEINLPLENQGRLQMGHPWILQGQGCGQVGNFMSAFCVGYMSRSREDLDFQAFQVPLPAHPLVSVIVTTFNSERYIDAALQSILSQTHANLEIVVVDDASTDDTRSRVMAMAAKDARIRLLSHGSNKGTYWSKNFGITRSRGSIVTFADSDDVNDPVRIQRQLEALRSQGAIVSTCNYHKLGPDGQVMPQASARRFAFITQMMRRELFDAIGYFDSVRTSADDEMLNRIRSIFGPSAHVNVDDFLYTALVRSGSLSNNDSNPKYSRATGGLSPARSAYLAGFTSWHRDLASKGKVPYMPFPLVRRPFPVDEKLAIAGEATRESINIIALTGGFQRAEPVVDALQASEQTLPAEGSPDEDGGLAEEGVFRLSIPDGGKIADVLASADIGKGYIVFVAPGLRYSQRHVERLLRVLRYHANLTAVCCASPDLTAQSGETGRLLLNLPVDEGPERLVQSAPLAMTAFHSDLLGYLRQGDVREESVLDAPIIEVALGADSPRFHHFPHAKSSVSLIRSSVDSIEHPMAVHLHDLVREKFHRYSPAFHTSLLRVPEEQAPVATDLPAAADVERPIEISIRKVSRNTSRSSELSRSLRPLMTSILRMWTRFELIVLLVFATSSALLAVLGAFALWRLAAVTASVFLFAIGAFGVFNARRTRLIHFPSQLAPEQGIRSTLVRTLAIWRGRTAHQVAAGRPDGTQIEKAPYSDTRRMAINWRKRLVVALRLSRTGRYAEVLASISEIEANLARGEQETFAGYATIARSLLFRRMGDARLSEAYLQESSKRGRIPTEMKGIIEGLSTAGSSDALIEQGLETLISSLQEPA